MSAGNGRCVPDINIVLIPGLDGTGLLAESFLREFDYAANTDVLVYPSDEAHNTLTHLAALLAQKIADNPRCVVIAESFGGLIVLEAMNSHRVRPQSIVWLATFGESPKPALLKLLIKLPIDYFPWARVPGFLLKQFAIGADATDAQVRLVQHVSGRVSPRLMAARLRIIADEPLKNLQTRWPMPCLYIQARHDKAVPSRCANWFQQRFERLAIERVDGGHFLLHTRPRRCADLIKRFIDGGAR